MDKQDQIKALKAEIAELECGITTEWHNRPDVILRARKGEFGASRDCPQCGEVLVWHKSAPLGDILGDRWEHWLNSRCSGGGYNLPSPECRCLCEQCGGIRSKRD